MESVGGVSKFRGENYTHAYWEYICREKYARKTKEGNIGRKTTGLKERSSSLARGSEGVGDCEKSKLSIYQVFIVQQGKSQSNSQGQNLARTHDREQNPGRVAARNEAKVFEHKNQKGRGPVEYGEVITEKQERKTNFADDVGREIRTHSRPVCSFAEVTQEISFNSLSVTRREAICPCQLVKWWLRPSGRRTSSL